MADHTTIGPPTRILVADGVASERRAMANRLRRAGYQVLEAADGHAARVAMVADEPDLILIERRGEGPDGFEPAAGSTSPGGDLAGVPVIVLLPASAGPGATIAMLDDGATDCLVRPFSEEELLARIRAAVRTGRAHRRREDVEAVLTALANAVEAKDPTTEHHCDRLEGLALDLAQQVGLRDDLLEAIRFGAVLHDVGKIGVPERLLRKPGPLTPAEWVEMQQHPLIGASIVAPLRLGRFVAPIVRGHHERWDGSGYPDALRHDRIPLGARIVTVVDAYDAMIHDRPYRVGRAVEDALEELWRGRDTQFDPALVELFVGRVRSGHGPAPSASGLVLEPLD